MARYEHLPIYKQAMDVAVHFERVVAGFSRYHKYTFDQKCYEEGPVDKAVTIKEDEPMFICIIRPAR